MNEEAFDQAAQFWVEKQAPETTLPEAEVRALAERIITSHDTCALATAVGDFVRCTPIEYTYHDGVFWIFSEGGMKFKALKENKNVSIAIFDAFNGFANIKSIQLAGVAELVEPFSEAYVAAAERRHISLARLQKMPSPMHLLKITPTLIEVLDFSLRNQGYNPRQQWQVTAPEH